MPITLKRFYSNWTPAIAGIPPTKGASTAGSWLTKDGRFLLYRDRRRYWHICSHVVTDGQSLDGWLRSNGLSPVAFPSRRAALAALEHALGDVQ